MVEVSCFSTTEADAINTAKPCRAACDRELYVAHDRYRTVSAGCLAVYPQLKTCE